jgi:hypothetical protein
MANETLLVELRVPDWRAKIADSACRFSGDGSTVLRLLNDDEMSAAIEQVNGLSPRGTVRERSDASGEGWCLAACREPALLCSYGQELIWPGARASRPRDRARKETAGDMLPVRG